MELGHSVLVPDANRRECLGRGAYRAGQPPRVDVASRKRPIFDIRGSGPPRAAV